MPLVIEVRHIITFDAGQLSGIESSLSTIMKGIKAMSEELDRLSTEVAENGAVIDSAVALINGLAQQIRDLKDDPAALAALADSLDAKSNELANAVAANTPAA